MNEDIFRYMESCLNEGNLPHAFLLETNDINMASEEVVKFLYDKQIIRNETAINNLNLVIAEPEGKEIKTAEIDNLKKRFATMPSNDSYNVYLIKEAEKMNNSAANKLLKFLEEPTDFILGFLMISEGSVILETIKSRCQIFKLIFQKENDSLNEQVMELIKFFENQNYSNEMELRKNLSSLERPEFITVIEKALSILANKLPKDAQFTITISSHILLLDNLLRLLKSNVNIELALDKLFIEAR